jgi:hypothetical protein
MECGERAAVERLLRLAGGTALNWCGTASALLSELGDLVGKKVTSLDEIAVAVMVPSRLNSNCRKDMTA